MSDRLLPGPLLAVRPYTVRVASKQVTVQFKTVFAWMKWPPLLLVLLVVTSGMLALTTGSTGAVLGLVPPLVLAVSAYVAYLLVVQRGYRPVNQCIRDAMRDGTAEFSGGAYSFGHPLTVTLPLEHAGRFLVLEDLNG